MHNNTQKFLLPLFLVLVTIVLGGTLLFSHYGIVQDTRAASSDLLSGWAWSSNIGWLSFNCIDQGVCGISNYGVTVGPNESGKKKLSGYAWTSNVGWISFNEAELSGCPSGPCKADINFITGEVAGWARAFECISPGCVGGWDGWISLSGANHTSPDASGNGGVTLNPAACTLKGYAWGGGDSANFPGWINFAGVANNGSPFGVILNSSACVLPPNQPTGLTISVEYCSAPWIAVFNWNFSDPNIPPSTQSGYEIEIDNDPSFASPEITLTDGSSSSPTRTISSSQLSFSTTYHVRVRVQNQISTEWSAWSGSTSFVTPIHNFPQVSFSISPASISADETIQFTDTTTFDTGSSGQTWLWSFGDGTPNSSTQHPVHVYSSVGEYTVTLTASDNAGSCSQQATLNVRPPLPEFKEVTPE